MNEEKLKALLELQEGVRKKVYPDSRGIKTVGIGRNLESVGLRPAEIDFLYQNDRHDAEAELEKYQWYGTLDDVRKAALIDMMFNLGASRFGQFHATHLALLRRQWDLAATQMMKSLWAGQVGQRAITLATRIRTGDWPRGV